VRHHPVRRGAVAALLRVPVLSHRPSVDRAHALALLRQALGDRNADFRPDQFEAIDAAVGRRGRVLLVQRTGWGKSMVYFLGTRLLRDGGAGPTLIVSPLLALMRDQVRAAERIGLRARTINSTNRAAWEAIKAEIVADTIDLLLISPERFANAAFMTDVMTRLGATVGMLVIDEAHCISDWGHDFRPDYQRIRAVLALLPPTVPVLATTATANDRVVADVRHQLGKSSRVVRGPLRREGLRLQTIVMRDKASRLAWLADRLPEFEGAGIVYTLTVADAERTARWLSGRGMRAEAYHGGMPGELRVALEEDLLANRVKCLVATTALSMGFDKPDLAFVVHFQCPPSAVHYYQQVGRAGRGVDGADGVLLAGREDRDIVAWFIDNAFVNPQQGEHVVRALGESDSGLGVRELQQRVNLPRSTLDKALKQLANLPLAPVYRDGSRWFRSPNPLRLDTERMAEVCVLRRQEWLQMQAYIASDGCLMAFLSGALDDADDAPCGACANCRGESIVDPTVGAETLTEAQRFLDRASMAIEPRKLWIGGDVAEHGFRGRIGEGERAEQGRVLALWGDAGVGDVVRADKRAGRLSDPLVAAAAGEFRRWAPEPAPRWVTCVPSLRSGDMVPDFARRTAELLGLPFVAAIGRTRHGATQKEMRNSPHQLANVADVFAVDEALVLAGPVLLIDDAVDSGWTFTIIAALLRRAGVAAVFPLAL